LFVGNFGGTGPGLATVNAGCNDVSVISPGTGLIQTFASGGLRPSSGFAGDFNGDGLSDLVVGNGGDGHLALLLGGPGGLSLSQTLVRPARASHTATLC